MHLNAVDWPIFCWDGPAKLQFYLGSPWMVPIGIVCRGAQGFSVALGSGHPKQKCPTRVAAFRCDCRRSRPDVLRRGPDSASRVGAGPTPGPGLLSTIWNLDRFFFPVPPLIPFPLSHHLSRLQPAVAVRTCFHPTSCPSLAVLYVLLSALLALLSPPNPFCCVCVCAGANKKIPAGLNSVPQQKKIAVSETTILHARTLCPLPASPQTPSRCRCSSLIRTLLSTTPRTISTSSSTTRSSISPNLWTSTRKCLPCPPQEQDRESQNTPRISRSLSSPHRI